MLNTPRHASSILTTLPQPLQGGELFRPQLCISSIIHHPSCLITNSYLCNPEMNDKLKISKVIVLTVTHFSHDFYTAILAPLLPKLIEKLQISYFSAGFLQFIVQIPLFFSPFISVIANKPHARYFVIFAPAVAAILMSIIGLVSSYWLLVLILFVVGVNSAFYHVPAPVMMKNVSGKNPGLGMSMHMVGGEAARAIGPMVVLGIISAYSFEGIWRIMPFGIVTSLFLLWLLRDVPVTQNAIKPSYKKMYAAYKRNKNVFGLILGLSFFRAILASGLTTYLPVYVKHVQNDYGLALVSLTVLEFGGMAGALLSGIISDFISRKRMIVYITVLSPLFMLFFLYMGNSIFSIIILAVLGFIVFSITPVLMAYVLSIKSYYPVFMNSMFMTINFVTGSMTVLMIGLSSDLFGLQNTFIFAALAALIAIPFAMALPESEKDMPK